MSEKNMEIKVHDFDSRIRRVMAAIEDLSEENSKLLEEYYKELVRNSLAEPTREKKFGDSMVLQC